MLSDMRLKSFFMFSSGSIFFVVDFGGFFISFYYVLIDSAVVLV